jgi:acetolactate synthase-1/2/3 large subunit
VQFAKGIYTPPQTRRAPATSRSIQGDLDKIKAAVALMAGPSARSSIRAAASSIPGPEASHLLRELVDLTGFPITSTLMGLGAYPASGKNWLGMLGMHGTYEANMAMHDCDVMVCIGARFDDRITGRLNAFSPNSKKIHIDIDPSSINKNVRVDIGILGDVGRCWKTWCGCGGPPPRPTRRRSIRGGSRSPAGGRATRSPTAQQDVIMPQYAIQRLYELTKDRDTYITTEVGQHQMWAAQHYGFEKPNRWMTSGGLGTMGYGLPAALGVQIAHPGRAGDRHRRRRLGADDHAGDVCAVQYEAPIKIFILNNQYMGMVRQWQQLLHGNRLSHSYTEAMPDFVLMAQAYGAHGIRCDKPGDLDDAIQEMIDVKKPVLFDCRVANARQLLPDDPVGQGAQRDAAARRGDRRGVSPTPSTPRAGNWCDILVRGFVVKERRECRGSQSTFMASSGTMFVPATVMLGGEWVMESSYGASRSTNPIASCSHGSWAENVDLDRIRRCRRSVGSPLAEVSTLPTHCIFSRRRIATAF